MLFQFKLFNGRLNQEKKRILAYTIVLRDVTYLLLERSSC